MRTWTTALLAILAAPGLALAAATPLSFEGVELGTTIGAWRALKPPGPVSEHARKACSDEPIGAAAGLNAEGLPTGAVICGVIDVHHSIGVPVTFSWGRQFALDDLRFVFLGGRLSEIRAHLPSDAFDALMADLKGSYGPPSQLIRDEAQGALAGAPRVTAIWTGPQGRIELVDPAQSGKLSVSLRGPDMAQP